MPKPFAMKADWTNPVHVATAILVALLVAAILAVNLSDADTDVISTGVLVLMLCACAVAGVRRGE